MTKSHIATLNVLERKELRKCEGIIEAGKQTFVEVGTAMAQIRDQKLYREAHKTFEGYCKARWGYERSYAHRLIEAAGVVVEMLPIGNKNGDDKPESDYQVVAPANEAQARALKEVPKEERVEILQEAAERNDGRPTVAAIKEVIAEREEAAPAQKKKTKDKPAAVPTFDDKAFKQLYGQLVRGVDDRFRVFGWKAARDACHSSLGEFLTDLESWIKRGKEKP